MADECHETQAMTGEFVVEVTEIRVEPPLVDRAPVRVTRLGIFSAWTTTLEWLGRRFAETAANETEGLVYYRVDEIVVDAELRVVRTIVFGADDRRRGIIDGGDEKPWRGIPPEECRYKPGDLVGFASPYAPQYRICIVLAQPPTPEAARRGQLTVADNVYLVATLDAEGKPETDDHAHVHRALLFPVGHDLSEALRALRRRRERYPR
jgi:hypothetical protein